MGLKTGMMGGDEFANALFGLSVKAQIVHFTFKTQAAAIQAEIELPILRRMHPILPIKE